MSNWGWTPDECVVLMYFASRQMCLQSISDVIWHKTREDRSDIDCQEMLRRIRQEEVDAHIPDPYDEVRKRWDLCAVDQWLLYHLPRNEIESLMTIDPVKDHTLVLRISEVRASPVPRVVHVDDPL